MKTAGPNHCKCLHRAQAFSTTFTWSTSLVSRWSAGHVPAVVQGHSKAVNSHCRAGWRFPGGIRAALVAVRACDSRRMLAPLVLFGFSKQRLSCRRSNDCGRDCGRRSLLRSNGAYRHSQHGRVSGLVENFAQYRFSEQGSQPGGVWVCAIVYQHGQRRHVVQAISSDPFNPVTALDLVRISLWKLLAFYLFVLFLLLSLVTDQRPAPAGAVAG